MANEKTATVHKPSKRIAYWIQIPLWPFIVPITAANGKSGGKSAGKRRLRRS